MIIQRHTHSTLTPKHQFPGNKHNICCSEVQHCHLKCCRKPFRNEESLVFDKRPNFSNRNRMKNSFSAIDHSFSTPSLRQTYLYSKWTSAVSPHYVPPIVPASTAARVSSLCLHFTLTTGTALFPFSGQTAHLQRQREGKGRGKGKKGKRKIV